MKADLFSFGLCLWEVLASELPLAHLKPAAAAADMAYRHARPPVDLLQPKGAEALVQACWHKVPEERPDFSQIVEELQALQECQRSSSGDSSIVVLGANHHHNRCTACSMAAEADAGTDAQQTNTELSGQCFGAANLYPFSQNSIRFPPLLADVVCSTGHVSALRSRWEQEASRGQTAFKSSHPTIEELRARVNPSSGYVEGSTYQYRVAPLLNRLRKAVAGGY